MMIAIIYKLGKGRSMFEIIEVTVPKWVMVPFYLFIIGVWIGLASMIMSAYIYIYKMMFFPALPASLFIMFFIFLSFQLLRGGIYKMAKAIVVLCAILQPMIFCYFILFQNLNLHVIRLSFLKEKQIFLRGHLMFIQPFGF